MLLHCTHNMTLQINIGRAQAQKLKRVRALPILWAHFAVK